MKILTVSDCVEPLLYTRFEKERFPGIELILSCGDLPPEYLTFLTTAFKVPLYYIRGNHDIRYGSSPPDGCIDLRGRLIRFKGLNFLGLEGSRWYNGGPYQYTEEQMRKQVRGLRRKINRSSGLDVVITHAPPRHIHDNEDLCHRGFRVFRWLIEKYAPRYFIHGHIHSLFRDPLERVMVVNHTHVVNSYGYYILEIGGDRMAGQGEPGLEAPL